MKDTLYGAVAIRVTYDVAKLRERGFQLLSKQLL